MKKFAWSFCLLALALCVSLPAMAQTTFYSNLGTGTDVYNCCDGWTMGGTGTLGTYYYDGGSFVSGASGAVTQLDVGVGYVTGTNSMFLALYTDSGGLPGTLLGQWNNLQATPTFGDCCGLLTVTGISGINLTAGTSYYIVMGPSSTSSTLWAAWNINTTGATDTLLQASSGCAEGSASGCNWNSFSGETAGAFDVLGSSGQSVPEPSSFLLMGTGLIATFESVRRKLRR